MILTMRYFIILIFLFIQTFSYAQEIVLSGYYNGINLFVQNPKIGEDQYCITNIVVNGRRASPLKQNSSFDIEMSFVEIGAPVEVRIQYHRECTPRVLNGDVIKKRNPFRFVFIKVTDSDIKWSSKGERKYGKYFVRRFNKNHWNTMHAINCKNDNGTVEYDHPIRHFSGENKYQIKYLDSSGKSYYSDTVTYSISKPPVTFSPGKVKKELTFSRKIQYRIMDISGKVLKSGFSDVVDCKNLETGIYYVAFENQIRQFTKK